MFKVYGKVEAEVYLELGFCGLNKLGPLLWSASLLEAAENKGKGLDLESETWIWDLTSKLLDKWPWASHLTFLCLKTYK